jgi:hypothetical protein
MIVPFLLAAGMAKCAMWFMDGGHRQGERRAQQRLVRAQATVQSLGSIRACQVVGQVTSF